MFHILSIIINIIQTSLSMFWYVLWPLILGFTLSGIVQSLVSHKQMSNLLGKDSIKCFSLATFFGMASSSCSYAAVALSRSIFQKGATFTSSMIFELASTNLVIELGIILFVLLGWQFTLAEFLGGVIMVITIALIFHFTLSEKLLSYAKKQMQKGLAGRMEGHAAMDMSVEKESLLSKIFSKEGFTSISHYFVMDWYSVWVDIAIGFIIAGALAVLVPNSFWQIFFLKGHPTLAFIEGPLIGPLVAIVSFVCSVGNIPLAAVLWRGGISFGGVISFIFADLIILPILDIYRKYYGWRVMLFILVSFYITMAISGYLVEILFNLIHITPTYRSIAVISEGIRWDYTSILDIIFLAVSFIFVIRFLKTNGISMIRMMDMPGEDMEHCHSSEGHKM